VESFRFTDITYVAMMKKLVFS